VEGVDELAGDGADLGVAAPPAGHAGDGADGALVDAGDGDDLGAGAGEEAFVGGVEVEAGDGFFDNGDGGRAGEGHDDLAGDAHEDAGVFGWGLKFAVLDDEDVVAGAFADVAEVVKHDGFGDAGIERFPLGHDVVEVVETLDLGGEAVGVIADDRGGDDGHAGLVHLLGVHLDLVGDDGGDGFAAVEGGDAKRASAAGAEQADVAVFELVGGDSLFEGGGELVVGVGHFEADALGGFIEAFEVGVFLEDAAVVLADAFENAVAVEQAVVVNGDFGIGF